MASPILSNVDTSFSKIVERLLDGMGTRLDPSAGSIARTLAEAYAREMATFYAMLELAHASGYLDTAEGGALDNVVAILGITRARAGRLTGTVEFSRASPAPDDIAIPTGCRVTGAGDADATPTIATTALAVLRRGETRVSVPVQEIGYDPKVARATPVIDPGKLTFMPRPVLGIEAVVNPAPLRRGSEDEGDDELRARARVAIREGEQGTIEAISAAVRREGVRQVTVHEPAGGPPGIIEVVVGDRDFAKDAAGVERVKKAIREAKAAGVRAHLLYGKTVYFQPRFEIEPADPNLDEGGLPAIEAYFLTALRSALSAGAALSAGPSASLAAGAARVEVIASRLTLTPALDDDPTGGRGPAHIVQSHPFPSDGATRDFPLPDDEKGEVIEVESPPGRPVKRGDDYLLEGRVVRFYHSPAKAAVAVIARVRGARCRGHEQVRPCRIDLTVRVRANERAPADELSRTALSAVLIAAEDLGTLDGSDPARPAVSLRLLRAEAALTSLSRSVETAQSATCHQTDIDFTVRGDLEQIVALGEPPQEGIIREVRRDQG